MPSQSTTWANAICRSGGYSSLTRHYRFPDGIEAVLPLFARKMSIGPVRINRSPPAAWGFGGALSTAPLAAPHVRAILDDCAAIPGAAVQIRPNPLLADVWSEAAHGSGWAGLERRAHVLDLAGGFDEVWNARFPGRTRTIVRKAEKLGITVESGSDDRLIEGFDRLFRLSLRRWAHKQNEYEWLASFRGQLRDPRHKFLEMARHAADVMRVFLAKLDGEAIAGIIVLYGHNAHYTRGAMDEQAVGNSGANFLLHRHAIREACERSCRHYHMGETGASDSLATFKEKFGAVSIPYAEYRHERIPVMSADQKLRAFVKRAIGFRDS